MHGGLHALRQRGQVVKRECLLHVIALRHFQLNGVHALHRLAVVAGDVTAFEAAIEDRAVNR